MKEKVKHWIIFKVQMIGDNQLVGTPFLVCEKNVKYFRPISNYETDVCVDIVCYACRSDGYKRKIKYGRFRNAEKKFLKLGKLYEEMVCPADLVRKIKMELKDEKLL